MRLYQKLILFMLAAAIGPLAVVGFTLLSIAERELQARIGAQQVTAAAAAAQMAGRDVDEAVESLVRAASPIQWKDLMPEERAGALRLLCQQSRHFAAAALLDAQGQPLAPVATRSEAEGAQPAAADDELAAFRAAIPLGELVGAGPGAVAMSPAYARPQLGAAAAALAVRIEGAEGAPWFVAVELTFQALQQRVLEMSKSGAGGIALLDGEGRVLAAPALERLLTRASPEEKVIAESAQAGATFASYAVGGQPVLAAAAHTPDQLGWTAIIQLPHAEAFRPVRQMRQAILASVGGALALLLAAGFFFTRGIARGIERLAQGAQAYGRGDLSLRIPVAGSDEMADLGRTFNLMGEELSRARKKLETWNEELQQKVEERTRELKEAQAQLLEAQKLAAIGQLGAGVAHEINNPLAGILGNTQLLLLDRAEDDQDVAALRKIEGLAKRAKEITSNLLRFSQQRPAADMRAVDLNRVVLDTLSLVETQIKAEGIEVEAALASSLPQVRGDPGHLSQVLLNLISNARTAMLKTSQKRLTLSTAAEGERVVVRIADTGKGISEANKARIFEPFFTTKDIWSNVGLGLSVSYRLVSDHGGAIHVATEVGKGSTFTVDLPRAPAT